ncbi:MAG: rhodanese-like domain-containing protein [Candidatus Scalindua sediminis]|nr:rhodanese-like domain-containing protein [Candidatus Scalindua sediminis]
MKREIHFILAGVVVLIGLGFLVGCQDNQQDITWQEVIKNIRNKFPDVRHTSTDELYSWLADSKGGSVILVDARDKEEFQVSHIPGARHIPYNENPSNSLMNLNRDSLIVVYCSVGYRSSILAKKLQGLGFTRVYNLEGSIFKWANEERPLVQNGNMVQKVHPYSPYWGKLLETEYHADVGYIDQ